MPSTQDRTQSTDRIAPNGPALDDVLVRFRVLPENVDELASWLHMVFDDEDWVIWEFVGETELGKELEAVRRIIALVADNEREAAS